MGCWGLSAYRPFKASCRASWTSSRSWPRLLTCGVEESELTTLGYEWFVDEAGTSCYLNEYRQFWVLLHFRAGPQTARLAGRLPPCRR